MKILSRSMPQEKESKFPNIDSDFCHLVPFSRKRILKIGDFLKKSQKIEFITVNYQGYQDPIWLIFGPKLQINWIYLVLKFKVDIFRASDILFQKTPKKSAQKT